MSSSFPTFTTAYSTDTGKTWNDVTSDVSEIRMSLRELVNGTGLTELVLNNYGGKYVAGKFPLYSSTANLETGLGFWWKWTINGVGPWYGRVLDLSCELDVKKELLHVQLGMMDDPLKNTYLLTVIPFDYVGNMIITAGQSWGGSALGANKFTMGGVTYTVNTSANGLGPFYPISLQSSAVYDCSRTRIFMIDFVKDVLTTVNDVTNRFAGWSGYVDSTQGPTSSTLYLFQQNAKNYASTITAGVNLSVLKDSRNIMRSKNWIEYIGALSNAEPFEVYPGMGGDAWTENDLSMWSAANSTTSFISDTRHFCPAYGREVTQACEIQLTSAAQGSFAATVDKYSIHATGLNIKLDLSLKTALGENFDATGRRNATSLNFYYKLVGGTTNTALPYSGTGEVHLRDNAGFEIIAVPRLLFANSQSLLKNPPGPGTGPPVTVWPTWSNSVGWASESIFAIGGTTLSGLGLSNSQVISDTWTPANNNTTATQFDWSNVTDILFLIGGAFGGTPSVPFHLYIDHLYFTESYQPVTNVQQVDAISTYGQRMQYYDSSMYTSDKTLQQFANARTTTLSPPAMQLNLVTSLTPDQETGTGGTGFQPGYSFPVGAVAIPNYGYDKLAWRAVEVETHLIAGEENSLTTRFVLTPASWPGVGVDPSKFDSRRFW